MKKITFSAIFIAAVSLFSSKAIAQDDASFDFSGTDNFVLIYLDDETTSQIPTGAKIHDYRADDVNHALWIWSDTYIANDAIGPNSNGVPGAFLDFTVANGGWSGFGFAGIETGQGKDMTKVTDNHFLHIAFKSTDKDAQIVGLGGGRGEAKLNFSDSPFNDNGTIIDVYDNFSRDGEWYSFDVPVKDLKKLGATYESTAFTGNAFFLLSGGRTGCNIAIDAIFYYTKGSSAIKDKLSEQNKIVFSGEYISVTGKNNGMTLYDVTGKEVKQTTADILKTSDLKKGMYIVRSGNSTKKVLIK